MLGGMDSIVIPVVCAVVEFGIKGNEREVEAKLDRPSLPATMLFNDRQIQGHHQGLRARSEGKRSWKSGGTLRYTVEASGMGQFNSPELAYMGNFHRGKFHDLSGDAKCSIGSTQRFTGGFEDGQLSGPGVMENFIDGEWRVTFRGTWKMSRPHTGIHYDSAGKPMMTVHEGTMTGVGGSAKLLAAPSAALPSSTSVPPDRMPPVAPAQRSMPFAVCPTNLTGRPVASAPAGHGPVDGSSASSGRHVSAVSSAQLSPPIPPERSHKTTAEISALIQRKLADPQLSLSLEDSLAVLKQCVELGSANAQRISGRTAVMVVGNTGAGKSTFLNYVAGCTMEIKSKKALGFKGLGNVVVVKPVSEGGRRDELVTIGHGKISQTFLPNVLIDDETELCFCDCPGFLDNRGAEINIANAVNLITTLGQAKEVKVIILISHKTVEADRGRGLSELITVCTKLFGSVDKLKQHLGCLLIGCSHLDINNSLTDLQGELMEDSPAIMSDLVERLFLVDVLATHEGWWDREECIEQIRSMPAITNPADVFHTVLLASDEKKLITMGMEMNRRVEENLRRSAFAKSHELYRTLELLSAIKHIAVDRIVHGCYMSICKYFTRESSLMKEHCHLSAFVEAEQVLQRLQAAAAVFQGEDWAEVLALDQLLSFYSGTQARHAEQVQRDQALQLRLQQAGNQIDLLTAALEATKQEAIRKENKLLERFETMRKELAQQLEHSNAMFLSSQQSLQEELSARLLAKEEETKLAYELRQQDVIDRLTAEKQAIEDEYRQQLESSKRKYEVELRVQREKEQASLIGQQRLLEETRKEKQAAEKRINDLQAQKPAQQNAANDTRKLQAAAYAQQQQESAATAVALLAQINLLDIAQSGDAHLLLLLEGLGALGSLTDINKVHPFKPTGIESTRNLTVLMIASCLGHTTVVQVLLKVPGVEVNLQDDKGGSTALIWAGWCGHTAVVQAVLADARVEVNLQNFYGATALMYASSESHTATVHALLADPRVEVNLQDEEEYTALMYASGKDHTAIVRVLLADARVQVNLQTKVLKDGCTALILASRHGRTAIVQALLADPSVQVNLQNKDGWTALIWASYYGHTATVQVLLADARVDINIKNQGGWTALDWAKKYNRTAIIPLLQAKGAQGK